MLFVELPINPLQYEASVSTLYFLKTSSAAFAWPGSLFIITPSISKITAFNIVNASFLKMV